jgi:MFS family permease
MRIAAVGSAVLLAAAAVSPAWWALAGALLLAGAANALAQPSSNSLLVDGVPAGRRAFAFGIKQSAIPASTLAGGLAVPVVALTVGWRWAFVGGALLAVAAAWHVPRLRGPGAEGSRPAGRVALERQILLLAVGAGSGAAAANCIGAFMTSSAVEAGFAAWVAGLLQAGGSALGLTVRVVTGWVADRRVRNARLVVAGMLSLGTVGIALLATGSHSLFVPGVALAFGAGWAWPGLLNFAIADRYQHAPAHATGVTQTGVYVGGAISPLIFGLLAEHVSLAAAWGSVAAFMAVAAVAVALSGRVVDRAAVGAT